MHSKHATSAAQEALDALKLKYPPRPLTITSTEATTDPLPDSPAVQDTTLPDAPSTAPTENDGWRTVEGKATQKKRRNDKADNKWAATTANNTPTTKNGGRGKNTHEPRTNTPSAKKTWADVVKSGGINVQIVLGNGNLGLTTPTNRRGERRGSVTRAIITTATATPPCDLRNHQQSHRFFHRIRIRHTRLRSAVNFQSVTRRFLRLSSRN
jgi:hypothetical protein